MKTSKNIFIAFFCTACALLSIGCSKEQTSSLPSQLLIKPNYVRLLAGTTDTTYVIKGGIPPYEVSTNDEMVTTGIAQDSMIIITGIREGGAELFVEDKNKACNVVIVKVLPSDLVLNFSRYDVALRTGDTDSVLIKNGEAPYIVKQKNTAVVQTTVNDKKIYLQGMGTGYAEVTITDAKSRNSVIAVTVQ